MYTLPRDFDGGFLVGKEIEILWFGIAQVNLTLAGGLWLQIEGSFAHRSASGEVVQRGGGFPLRETTLVRLVGCSITGCRVIEHKHLLLEFSGGDQLFVSGDNGMYEAYRIFDGGREILV